MGSRGDVAAFRDECLSIPFVVSGEKIDSWIIWSIAWCSILDSASIFMVLLHGYNLDS